MTESEVRAMLYDRYIAPIKPKADRYVGIEIEMPIVNLDKGPVDFFIIHEITDRFLQEFGFEPVGRDDDGYVHAAKDAQHGDVLSFDCSYNNLEFSLGRERNLMNVYERFCGYYNFWQEALREYHYTLTGMGINPYRQYNHNVPIPNGRYRMLFHHLQTYKEYDLPMYFHHYPDFGTFSSASQVQLDMDSQEDFLRVLHVFGKLEPIKALLFSNSVLLGENEDLICARDMFWENSTHGINLHNVGMYQCEFETIEEFLNYLESTSIYCVERDDKYINFAPVNLVTYFRSPEIEGEFYADGMYHKIAVHPQPEDIQYLRTFKFLDLTFRGTIEFRSVCCQPIRDCMTVAAFHVGLKHVQDQLYTLLEEDQILYHRGYTASELRKLLLKKELPEFIKENDVYELAGKILELAKEGLRIRGYGEEKLLAPLFERVKERTNPAKTMLNRLQQGEALEDIIVDYGKL